MIGMLCRMWANALALRVMIGSATVAVYEIKRKNWEAAIKHGRNALLGDKDNINAFLNIAIAYFKQGQFDQAGLVASAALESHPDENARQAGRDLRARSPFAVFVTLRALIRAQKLQLSEVLDQDLRLAEGMIPMGDFVEGVRALLIDKDNDPHWRYATLEDVLERMEEVQDDEPVSMETHTCFR